MCDGELNPQYKKWSDTVKQHTLDWEYKLWSDVEIQQFRNEHFPEYENCIKKYKYKQQVFDATRYMILYKLGGLYVDMDIEFFKPPDDLIKSPCTLFLEYMDPLATSEYYKYFTKECPILTNSIMYAESGCKFMKSMVRGLLVDLPTQDKYTHPGTIVVMCPGPGYLSKRYYMLRDVLDVHLMTNIHYEPISKIERKHAVELNKPYKKTSHGMHWNVGSWIINPSSSFKIKDF